MSEQEPSMHLTMDGKEFDSTPDNTTLFTFAGGLAMYNHVFVATSRNEQENVQTGTYVFSLHDAYNTMRDYMLRHEYPAHINLRSVAQCDQDAFNRMMEQQAGEIDGGIPDEWE